MPLSKDFKLTVMARARKDKAFCNALLSEAVTELLSGDIDLGKAMLRDYINAAITFELLSSIVHKNPKSLMRMLSQSGNPTSKSLFEILQAIQKIKHTKISVIVKN